MATIGQSEYFLQLQKKQCSLGIIWNYYSEVHGITDAPT